MFAKIRNLLIVLAATVSAMAGQGGPGTPEELLERALALPATSVAERVDLCRQGIRSVGDETPVNVVIALHVCAGEALIELQRFEESFAAHEMAASLSRASGDDLALIVALYNIAFVGTHTGDFERSLDAALEVVSLAGKFGRTDIQVQGENLVGTIHERMGDRERAMAAYSRALRIVEDTGDLSTLGTLLNNLGVVRMNAGLLDDAQLHFERARGIAEANGDRNAIAAAVANLGDMHLLAMRLDEALASHRLALELRLEAGSEGDVALSYSSLGGVFIELGEPEQAIEHLQLAREVQERLGQKPGLIATLGRLSRAYAAMDSGAEAVELAILGGDVARAIRAKSWQARTLEELAAAYEASGDSALALDAERRAMELDRKINSLESARAFARHAAESEARLLAIQKNLEIAALERDGALAETQLMRERLIRNCALGGSISILLLGFVGWRASLAKRRAEDLLQRSRRMERRLLESQKLESLGLLSGGVAHDFNNLLMIIRGNSELARSGLDDYETITECLSDIETACERGTAVVQQMLFDSGAVKLEKAPVDLAELARETVELVEGAFSTTGPGRVRFAIELEPGVPPVLGDKTQLGQLILNLLTNACQAIDGKDGVVTTRLSLHAPAGESSGVLPDGPEPCVQLEIADTGSGMGAEALAKLYDPFFTTKREGRGLGLATVQGIVRRHEGTINVTSELGAGTVFTVLLPAAKAVEVALATETSSVGVEERMRALVIGDEEGVLVTAGLMLEPLGFEAVLASSSRAGLDQLEGDLEVDLVISDLVMPSRDGQRMLTKIREMRPELPVLFISGHVSHETLQRLRREPKVEFLTRPFGVDALGSRLTALLGSGALRPRAARDSARRRGESRSALPTGEESESRHSTEPPSA